MIAMKLSDKGLAFIAGWEGWRAKAYQDVGGKWTIGYGHLIAPSESALMHCMLTEAQGLALLRHDIGIAEHAVNAVVDVAITQGQFDALVSFAFNCGTGALATSTMLKYLDRGEYHAAASEFLRWDKVGGVSNAGLRNRRASERALFEPTLAIQKALNAKGWTPRLTEDGAYGPLTGAALGGWQTQHGIQEDGFGPKTEAALGL